MRSRIITLAALAGFTLLGANQAHAAWEAYYPPVNYHPGHAYPTTYTMTPHYSYQPPPYEWYGTNPAVGSYGGHGHSWLNKQNWNNFMYGPPPAPPGSAWHPYVRSPRDFYMMERP